MTTQTISREQLQARIEKALKDFTEGRATMHVPPFDTDVDMVLSECMTLLAGMGSEPVAVPDERKAFEAFMEKRFKDSIDRRQVKNGDGEYFSWDMVVAWIVWQRRATMQAEPVSQRYTLPPHIYRELINQLRDTAVKYQGCQQLREQLSETLSTVITPAAPEQKEGSA